MQRALIWLNLYGCEAVRHKPQNSLKTPKTHFLPVFELMSFFSKENTKEVHMK
jgi:hypothetical protein